MRRTLSRIFISMLVAAALAILAFGPRPAESGAPDRVHIQYWEKWTGLEAEQMRQIVDAFNDTVGRDKHIWVDFVSMSQIDRKTLISTAGGVPPDVAGLWDTQVCQFGAKGALEPLDSYAAAAGLTRDQYKPVFYDGCIYGGHLIALPSTAWSVALIYNKALFEAKADALRAAGLDPDRGPRSIDELDRYAAVLDTWDTQGNTRRLVSTGYSPSDPGSFLNLTVYWFFGDIVDASGKHLLLTSPAFHRAYDWIRSYSERLGRDALNDFRGGLGGFDSPANPFLTGQLAMEQQGAWISTFVEKLKPEMHRWHVPPERLEREKRFEQIVKGMRRGDVLGLLGAAQQSQGEISTWTGGIENLTVRFEGDAVAEASIALIPAEERRQFCQWGAVPFPSVDPTRDNVTYAGMDVLVIPRGSKHKQEAFEFIKFVNRQDQMEHLCSMHGVLAPLAKTSPEFLRNHPNPYVGVFNALAESPNARALPRIPNWPQIFDELTVVSQNVYLMNGSTDQILSDAQRRCQQELDDALQQSIPPTTDAVAGAQ